MPLRDYELVQKAKRDGWVKVSIKGMTRALDCDPAACQGLCCRGHNSVLASHYHPDELAKLPENLRHLVAPDGTIFYDNKGNCSLIPHCLENPSIIPNECRLFPLRFNSSGRLVMTRWAWVKPCPSYNKGRPIYISMRQCLVDVFGEEVYNNILLAVENNVARF